MKFAVIFAIAVACAMGAPPTTNAGQSTNTNPAFPVSDDAEGVVKRSPASSLVNQNTKKIVRRRPVNLIDANGKLIDLDDDDLQIVTTDLSGRSVAFQPKQNPIPVVNRVPLRSSSVGSVSTSGQATGDIIFINDDSRETDDFDDDFDDLDDLTIISPNQLSSFPFVNRQSAARLVSQSSVFNPSTSFVRPSIRPTRMKPRFVQSASTCTCPPQRESVFQFSRFPQQSVNRFTQFGRFPFSSFPGVQFVFDD